MTDVCKEDEGMGRNDFYVAVDYAGGLLMWIEEV